MSLRELLAYKRQIARSVVSSAKWHGVSSSFLLIDLAKSLYKSFMYMRNNKGPKMKPCGTPYLMVWISDLSLLMVTC